MLILDFVEARFGIITNRQFNEAVDGVFRQAKPAGQNEPKQKSTRTAIKKKKCTDRQQSIDIYYSKKSISNTKHKSSNNTSTTMLDSDLD